MSIFPSFRVAEVRRILLAVNCWGLLAFALISPPSILQADDWASPQTRMFTSEGGRYACKVVPQSFQSAEGRMVRFAEDGEDQTVWRKPLVNVPMRAFLPPRRTHLVTVDTYANLGYEHSLVLYDAKGKVVADYKLEQLLEKNEIRQHVPQSVSSRWWAEQAKFRFEMEPQNERFVIELPWGKTLSMKLANGELTKTMLQAPAPGEVAKPLPAGRYTGGAMVMQVEDGKTIFADRPPAICHLQIRSNRLRAEFPDPVLGRGEWRTMNLVISQTAPRQVWKLQKGERTYQATAVLYSPQTLLLQLEIRKDDKVLGGAWQFYGVELE